LEIKWVILKLESKWVYDFCIPLRFHQLCDGLKVDMDSIQPLLRYGLLL
jgi:hypothetical protein